MKLCEKMGRRLRRKGYIAHGIHVSLRYKNHTYWHHAHTLPSEMYTTIELYRHAQLIFNAQPQNKPVTLLSVSCYGLTQHNDNQLSIFGDETAKKHSVSDATDKINDTFGEFTVVPGIMMDMDEVILDRIAFGGVRELEEITTSFAG
jgi:hypothetical protein